MKHTFIFLLLVSGGCLFGQTVPNGDFEEWNSISFSSPEGWRTSNSESVYNYGLVTASEVAGITGSAIRIETLASGTSWTAGYFTNTSGDPLAGEGGFPYTQQPESLDGYMRYLLPGSDTAIFVVVFKKNGIILSTDIFKIRGSGSQSDFASFSFPLSLNEVPDSVVFACASSNLITEVGVEPGSFLELDDLHFSGVGINQIIPNGDFENWTNQSYDLAQGWIYHGESVGRISPGYTGNYAAIMTTTENSENGIWSSGMAIGQLTDDGPVYGYPYSALMDTLKGFYKYATPGADVASISVSSFANTINVGGAYMQLTPASEWTYFEMPFNSMSMPDTLKLDISSSAYPYTNATAGSTLVLDRLYLTSQPLLLQVTDSPRCSVYPNPVVDEIQVQLDTQSNGYAFIRISDGLGKTVFAEQCLISGNLVRVPVSALASGNYYFNLQCPQRVYTGRFVKQ